MKRKTPVQALIDGSPRPNRIPKIARDAMMTLRLPSEIKRRLEKMASYEKIKVAKYAERYLDALTETTLDRAKAVTDTMVRIQAIYADRVAEAGRWGQRLEQAVRLVEQQRSAYNELRQQYSAIKGLTLGTEIRQGVATARRP